MKKIFIFLFSYIYMHACMCMLCTEQEFGDNNTWYKEFFIFVSIIDYFVNYIQSELYTEWIIYRVGKKYRDT